MGRLKSIWHDPVWSKVIAALIIGVPAVAVTVVNPLRSWVFTDITLSRSLVIAWTAGGVILGIALGVSVMFKRNGAGKDRSSPQSNDLIAAGSRSTPALIAEDVYLEASVLSR